MSKVLIIGAGGVGRVTVYKCAMNPGVFTEILFASRTKSKCDEIAQDIKKDIPQAPPIKTAAVDADNVFELVSLIRSFGPKLIINVALPYQDLSIMEACLETGVDYLDTANYEHPDEAKFEYSWQWKLHDKFKAKKLMALLGSGFDPGVTNVYTAYAAKHYFDEIHTLDIVDCNAGDHGKAFATNFNPEINIREITQNGKYWEDGKWVEIPPHSVGRDLTYPGVGPRKSYVIFHEELESLVKHFPTLKRARFWMTFSDNYLNHLRVIQNIGMARIDPVIYEGKEIIPLKFLKAVLPDPGSLGENYSGETSIGVRIFGIKDGKQNSCYIWNNCKHQDAYKETKAQGVSYTTGVPAVVGAKMMLTQKWRGEGVFNMEQFDPDPFMQDIGPQGLPWEVKLGGDLEMEPK